MRTAAVVIAFLLAPRPAFAEPPAGFVFDVVTAPEVDEFAQDATVAVRAELARAALLDVTGPGGRIHGTDEAAERLVTRARSLLAESIRAYDNLELDDAIAKLGRVVADLDAGWVAVDDSALLVDALIRLGAALVLDGRPREAEVPFARAHVLAPDRQPDPEVYPEQVTSRFQQVVARTARAGVGSLEVRATPQGALVTVDGRFVGRAPTTVEDLAVGTHLVRLRSPGHVDRAATVTVRAGREEAVNVRLAPVPGVPDLADLVGELAGTGAGAVDRIGELVGLRVLVVLRFAPSGGGSVAVEGLRYDLSSTAPPQRRSATVSADPDGVEEVVRLGVALVREGGTTGDRTSTGHGGGQSGGGSGPGIVEPPSDEPGITSRWWFWTGIAAVVVAGVAIGVVLTAGGSEPGQRPEAELVLRF